ncbi:agmatinase [Pontimicrobium aquaticum]|uniref:Agmatinase n=1 Tax=Pontimicrobium aquaticum TaxID=2565367 RepID=A0A4V5LR28_9FLAO|nr:agmatinase [Pontimicrobium aquaticum]TJY37709.1 agmatinase [Pontimicrobium aquaticum]
MLRLIGIPYDANSSYKKGSALAPEHIRLMDEEGSANKFCEQGKEIIENVNYKDCGDIAFTKTDAAFAYNKIKETISNELKDGSKIISLGGDHSISFPVIEAFSKKHQNLNVLHLDAHADLYDNFENNPYSHASPFARLMERGCINSLTQVGIRTFNTHQREQAKRFGVKIIEMKDFNTDFINSLESPLYISLDIDVLDPAFAPGISHHEPGGMTTRQLLNIIQNINVPIVGADIVELNPKRDINNVTAMVAYKLFKELASKMIN